MTLQSLGMCVLVEERFRMPRGNSTIYGVTLRASNGITLLIISLRSAPWWMMTEILKKLSRIHGNDVYIRKIMINNDELLSCLSRALL